MGSHSFIHGRTSEKTAEEAFRAARAEAQYDYGHAGYTGTIAEKDKFIMLPLIEGKTLTETIEYYLYEQEKSPVDDKWGPAGCIKTDDGFMFFGWASC